MKKVLVTGGCGFIGSNFIKYLLTNPEVEDNIEIINLDKQTYAGKGKNIEHMLLDKDNRSQFIKGDIADKDLVNKIFSDLGPELIFNFAAESHVDRSITESKDFVVSNIIGAVNLFDTAKNFKSQRIVQISTDEVYGSLTSENKPCKETDTLYPRSPYSASKAAAEHLAMAYFHTHGLPVVITRSANNYGPYQFPEKLLPLFITNLIEDKKIPLMWSKENPGLNVRDWLHVGDNCRAIWFVAQNGKEGEVYNIPGGNERTNIEITEMLLNSFNYDKEMIEKIDHRKAHDFRYSMRGDKLKELGFSYHHKNLGTELRNVVEWYKQNEKWWRPLKK